jgi:hypothetical protein
MSTESHKGGPAGARPPHHEDVAFEPSDVRTRSIITFLAGLAATLAASFLLAYLVYRGATRYTEESYAPPPASREGAGPTLPPEPRLQGVPGHLTDAQQDWRNKKKEDTKANEKLEWIDRSSGIAQIPVKDAMKIIVEKGLPAVPAPPAEKK